MKKIITVATCIIIITVSALSLLLIRRFEDNTQAVKTDIGNEINFYQTENNYFLAEVPDWYMYDALTDGEINTLFGKLPISAIGVFNTKNSNNMVGVEGKINDVSFSISPHMQLVDIYILGKEQDSYVKGIPVTAGYACFINGEGNTVTDYYAIFELGENTFYLDKYVDSDYKATHKSVRNEIADAIESLIDNGEIDFSEIKR